MSGVSLEGGNAIDRVAAHWVARGIKGLSAAEKAELDAWRAADPRHSGSYLRALAIERLAATSQAPTRMAVASNDDPVSNTQGSRRVSRRQLIGAAIAASLVATVGVATYSHLRIDRLSTERGEIRNVPLSDGSAAVLDTGSAIAVSMQPDRRIIDLEAGKAWFDVAHDSARPFEVRHGGMIVRATGTAFQVTALPNGIEVIVTEGSVAVLREDTPSPLAHLQPGGQLSFVNGQARQQLLDAGRVEQRLAWRQGMIVLDGRTLAEAVDEINSYNVTQIQIASPALAARRVYGTFRARDPEGLARALAIAMNSKMEHSGAVILLSQ